MRDETVWLCLMRCVCVTGANLPGQGTPAFFQNKQNSGRSSSAAQSVAESLSLTPSPRPRLAVGPLPDGGAASHQEGTSISVPIRALLAGIPLHARQVRRPRSIPLAGRTVHVHSP